MSSSGKHPVRCVPSILAADYLRLGEQVAEAEAAGVERFHIDVMDGLFVPNFSLGIPIVEAMRRGTKLPLEIHLMVQGPERYTDNFIQAGGDLLILHQESTPNLHRAIQQVKEKGKQVGVAINPGTSLSAVEDVLEPLELLLLMTVNPGFGGQKFIHSVLPKLRKARALLDQYNPACELEVDGGVDVKSAPLAVAAGANVLVGGSCIFGHPHGIAHGIRALREAAGG